MYSSLLAAADFTGKAVLVGATAGALCEAHSTAGGSPTVGATILAGEMPHILTSVAIIEAMATYNELTSGPRGIAEELLRISTGFLNNLFVETADVPYRLKKPQKDIFGNPKEITNKESFKACLSMIIPFLMGAVYYRNKSYLRQQETFGLYDGMSGGKFFTSTTYANAAGIRITVAEHALHQNILDLCTKEGVALPFINVRPAKTTVESATIAQIKAMADTNEGNFMGKAKLQDWVGDYMTYLGCVAQTINILIEWGQAKHACRDYERVRTLVEPKGEATYKSQRFLQLFQELMNKSVIFGEYPYLNEAVARDAKADIAAYNADREAVMASARAYMRALEPYFRKGKERTNSNGKGVAALNAFMAQKPTNISEANARAAVNALIAEAMAEIRNINSEGNGKAAAGGGGGVGVEAKRRLEAAKKKVQQAIELEKQVTDSAVAAASKAEAALEELERKARRFGGQGGGTRRRHRDKRKKSRRHQ